MFNRTRHPLLPRFVAALTASAFVSTGIAPAFAADPVPASTPAPDAKPAEAKPKPPPPDKKTKDAARKAYQEGDKAYLASDYATAYTGFSKANELVPSPQAAYWAAKSLDAQAKEEDAIKAYEALLADPELPGSKLGDDKINDAKTRLSELKGKQAGDVTIVTTPIGAAVSVDGAPQQGATPMTVKLSPGPHKLTVAANGYEPKDLDIEVKGGEKSEQKLELIAKAPPPVVAAAVVAAPPPPPPPPPEPRSKVPAYVTLGIAGAGAVVGTIFGIKALSSKNEFDKNPTGDAADDTERNALIADMAFGVAITLGVTGVVLLTSDDSAAPTTTGKLDKLPKKAKLVVAPYASPKGGGAAAQYTF
ncbi:MAG TPA: PEGA domain-containing protein [Polyangiaceae bacterium]